MSKSKYTNLVRWKILLYQATCILIRNPNNGFIKAWSNSIHTSLLQAAINASGLRGKARRAAQKNANRTGSFREC